MFAKWNPIAILIVIAFLAIGISLVWNVTARAAYESAEYRVVESDGDFEIRDYPDLVLVSTESSSTFQGSDGSFMRLFRYISGDNAKDQKVAMTTPVFMDEKGDSEAGNMAFVVPKDVALRGAPAPAASDVKLRTREGGRFAVLRFSGRLNRDSAEAGSKRLRKWLEQKGIKKGYSPT